MIFKSNRCCFLFILTFHLLSFLPAVASQETTAGYHKQTVLNINTSELLVLSQSDETPVYIDVRTPQEIAEQGGTLDLPRVYNVDRGWLERKVPERVLNKNTLIVVFCEANQRSPLAAKTLLEMGYTNVRNYVDGFLGWQATGLPIEKDDAPDSMLYSLPREVIPNVWSAIGFTGPGSYFNSGHNYNLTFIITSDDVVLVNARENYLLAKALHDEIKSVTDKKVKYVILENGQGHAMLGSAYWQEQGAKIIAHSDAAKEIEAHGSEVLKSARMKLRDKLTGTFVSVPDIIFDTEYNLSLGGVEIDILDLGPTHSPGDIVVWLPKEKLVISGDVAFHERMLPVFEHTDTDGWIKTWEAFLALGAEIVIPGHGKPTNYDEVTKYTRDYLQFMRNAVGQIIDNDGELQDAYLIDQSKYSHLDTYFELSRQNSGRIFREMEFE